MRCCSSRCSAVDQLGRGLATCSYAAVLVVAALPMLAPTLPGL